MNQINSLSLHVTVPCSPSQLQSLSGTRHIASHPSPAHCPDTIYTCSFSHLSIFSFFPNVIVWRVCTPVTLPVGLFASVEVVLRSLIRTILTLCGNGIGWRRNKLLYVGEKKRDLLKWIFNFRHIADINHLILCHRN